MIEDTLNMNEQLACLFSIYLCILTNYLVNPFQRSNPQSS